jgi:hypothetical protein
MAGLRNMRDTAKAIGFRGAARLCGSAASDLP